MTEALISLTVAVLIFLIFLFGFTLGEDAVRCQAVEVGVAEYYLDANNDKQWRWVTP